MASTLEALERYPVPHSAAKLMTRIHFCVGRLDSTKKILYFSCIVSKGFGTPFESLFAEIAYPGSGDTRAVP